MGFVPEQQVLKISISEMEDFCCESSCICLTIISNIFICLFQEKTGVTTQKSVLSGYISSLKIPK